MFKNFLKPTIYFNADGVGVGGSENGAGDNTTSIDINTSTGEGETGNGETATFTQADLDRIAGRTRKESISRFIKDLGMESVDDLKAIIASKQQADEQSKSDLEKANEKLADAENRAQAAIIAAKWALIRSEFNRIGSDKLADLDLAFMAAGDLLNHDEIEIDLEKSNVSGVDKIIDNLIKEKPILKKIVSAQPGNTGGAERGTTSRTELTPEEDAAERRKRGIRPRRE